MAAGSVVHNHDDTHTSVVVFIFGKLAGKGGHGLTLVHILSPSLFVFIYPEVSSSCIHAG